MITQKQFEETYEKRYKSGSFSAAHYMDIGAYKVFLMRCSDILNNLSLSSEVATDDIPYQFGTICFLLGFELGKYDFEGEA